MADATQTASQIGQDPYQVADAINRQKISDTRKRNEMMRLGTSDPSSFYMQNQGEIQQAQMPTEYLSAGRTSDIPSVSMDGQQYQTLSNDAYSQMLGKMPELGTSQYNPDYSNDVAKYYSPTKATELNNLSNIYSYMDKLSKPYTPHRQLIGGVQVTPSDLPSTATEFMSRYGSTPEGGWNDATTYRGNNVDTSLQGWMSDSSLLPKFSLAGDGSDEAIKQGFNVLQHMAPRNIGEFWSLNKDAQLGMLEHPDVALQQMRALANPANGDWLSVGAEGGFSNMNAYNWSNTSGLSADPNQYLEIHDDNRGLLGSLNQLVKPLDPLADPLAQALGFNNSLDAIRSLGEPIGNILGMAFLGGVPVGSMVMAADNASMGNDKAIMGNVINGVVSYGGAKGYLGNSSSVMNSGTSLGSPLANSAANSFLVSAATNYARTGDLESALKAAAVSAASGAAGNWIGDATKGSLGDIGSKALGGAASGGISSLFSKNSPLAGSLYGGMSGGLYGLLNSMGRNGEGIVSKEDTATNKQIAKTATQLARTFINK